MKGEILLADFGSQVEPLTEGPDLSITEQAIRHAGMNLRYLREQASEQVDEYTIWVPGFFGIHSAYSQLRHEASLLDGTVGNISMHAPRKQDLWHALTIDSALHPSHMLSKAIWGIMKDTAEATGVERFNLVGHSMGGPAVVNAAQYVLKHKDGSLINSVTLNGSAGVTEHSPSRLVPKAYRLLKDELAANWPRVTQQVGGEERLKAANEIIRYMFHVQTFREAVAVSYCDIRRGIGQLSEAGIPTAALYFPADPLFDAEIAEENLRNRVNIFRIMENPHTAGHAAPHLYPAEVALENHVIKQQFERTDAA